MAELGMAGDFEDVADAIEVEARPRPRFRLPTGTYAWRAPRWLPAALVVGVILWSAGIWWMASNLSGDNAPPVDSHALTDEIAVLRAKVDSLTQQTATIGQEREALAKRVAAIEARPATPAITTPAAQAATAPPGVVTMDLTAEAYSIPRFAYPRSTDPRTTPATVYPAAIPTRGTSASAGSEAGSRFVTNGADRYNCTSFGSQAEAQEALAANAPGDPNRLDMNGNGVACEDITYPANTPKNLTPVPNR
ncbi:MAG: hypothetical protein C4558_06240 [Dehalococcoidia bacterium]|nr:MAG: hypothetical protein C4558_06240 [Dehalococcoidia bacterium]